jgi:hypothetical protein
MILFPKIIRESDLPQLQRNMRMCILKSVEHSIWACDRAFYREYTALRICKPSCVLLAESESNCHDYEQHSGHEREAERCCKKSRVY